MYLRHYRGYCGVSEPTFTLMFELLQWYDENFKPKYLTWALYFMRNYPTQDVLEILLKKIKPHYGSGYGK